MNFGVTCDSHHAVNLRRECTACVARGPVIGFEYKSEASLGSLPLLHITTGVDAATGRPRVARGVIAMGNIAVGGVAIGGVALGLFALGGLSIGLLLALGGTALSLGVSFGGLAVGSVAVEGLAVGFSYAVGGAAFGPAVIDGQRCDEAARQFFSQWLGQGRLPPSCH
jgi:hypothetical protein